jgi:hypothetical protein
MLAAKLRNKPAQAPVVIQLWPNRIIAIAIAMLAGKPSGLPAKAVHPVAPGEADAGHEDASGEG